MEAMMTGAQTLPRVATSCEETVRWEPGQFRSVPVACSQSVGVTTWIDQSGRRHAGCSLHVALLKNRFPPITPEHLEHERYTDDCPDCRREYAR